jgi:hypothetical protein
VGGQRAGTADQPEITDFGRGRGPAGNLLARLEHRVPPLGLPRAVGARHGLAGEGIIVSLAGRAG